MFGLVPDSVLAAKHGEGKMFTQRTLFNFWLDVVLLVLFLACLWIAFLIRFVFPPATLADGWRLWGWTYDHWADAQFLLLCLFGLSVLLHVMMHWSWVCGVVTSRLLRRVDGERRQWDDGIRTLYGVGFLILILIVLGIAFAAAMLSVVGPN